VGGKAENGGSSRAAGFLRGIAIPAAAVAAWQFLSTKGYVNPLILPAPSAVLARWYQYLAPMEAYDPARMSYAAWVFSGELLHALSRGRRVPVKQFVMDARIVTGIGNIYANEALFAARIHPSRAAGRISRSRYDRLAGEARATLSRALAAGGSTLRDFVGSDGEPGHFQLEYAVYGREGEPCPACGSPIRSTRHAGRSTFYCASCQR
jgi:hypothetical protein